MATDKYKVVDRIRKILEDLKDIEAASWGILQDPEKSATISLSDTLQYRIPSIAVVGNNISRRFVS